MPRSGRPGHEADEIADLTRTVLSLRVPLLPDWLAQLPLIGARATQAWAQLTVAIAAILYARGERGAAAVIRFGRRLGGERGEMAVRLAGQAIRGVALGVVVTAIAQSVLGGIGLAIVGMPFAAVLTALMFMLCLCQVGPAPVLIPAIVWMYYSGDTLWATVLLAFTIVVVSMDNFLRPMLIRKGADLPLLLILAGVIGGLIAFGLLGIFVGPRCWRQAIRC